MWEGVPRFPLDVRVATVIGTSSPCGENRGNSSTELSTGRTGSHPIHILEFRPGHAHIWGSGFMDIFYLPGTCPQPKVLIHKKSRVIHKFSALRRAMGGYPATIYGNQSLPLKADLGRSTAV